MPRRNKFNDVIVLSDSDGDNDVPGARCAAVATEDELEESSPNSDDEDESESSSFKPSGDELEFSESDDDDDRDYGQSDDDQSDEDGSEPSPCPSEGGGPGGCGADDETLCRRIVELLQEKRNIGNLSLKAYRAYLRRHGLRISGSKDECEMRIHTHWRIKDGKGEALYPRSSFVINCTGDVCKGDVVLFRQGVYQKFDKVRRSGKVTGSRTVAGRVVKESYGAAKQQHTFTVEVLWTKGANKLPPLFPLLIKGRNLYRLKTFRQPWKNEAERSRALNEKHERGAAARRERETRILNRQMHQGRQSSDRGQNHGKRHSTSTHTKDHQRVHSERDHQGQNHGNRRSRSSHTSDHQRAHSKRDNRNIQHGKATANSPTRRRNPTSTRIKAPTSESHPSGSHRNFHTQKVQPLTRNTEFSLPRGHVATSSSAFMANPAVGYYYPPHLQAPITTFHSTGFSHSRMPVPEHSSGFYNIPRGPFGCSTPGCRNLASEGCAVSGCWHCCRATRLRCRVHN